ncbi:hypothetical protein KP509_37G065800 [Ceratopteris richardii]|uniref:Uncharacterized protein n=1 Tax=Ceratopteris richardii TaxID=49495 RepID=A0A8T2Q9X2_CERRI|nr:hypothetical protein KP509_37G065800 [Ceratopteris richardii]
MAVHGRAAADHEDDGSSFYLAKCMLRSSVVLQAVCGHIRSPTTVDIVFGKETSLELIVLSEDGVVQSVCEQPVFGKIKDMKVLPWNEQLRCFQPQTYGKDLLVVTSDSGKLSFLTFCVELHRFLAVCHIHISQPGNARRDLGPLLTVEARGRAIAVSALEDKIAVYPVSAAAGNNIVEKKMMYPKESWEKDEHTAASRTIWSMAFVPGSENVDSKDASIVLAVLVHRKGAAQNELLILFCDIVTHSIQLGRSPTLPPGSLAYSVYTVPVRPGLIFLFRYGEILLLQVDGGIIHVISSVLVPGTCSSVSQKPGYRDVDEDERCAYALLELRPRAENAPRAEDSSGGTAERAESTLPESLTDEDMEKSSSPLVCAWTWCLDASFGPTLVISVENGEMFLLHLVHYSSNEMQLSLSECLYHFPPLKCLLWMEDGFLLALAEMGDGQVLYMKNANISYRSTIENISPILDFSLADYHRERQDQMFACTGAGLEGSLRVIHNGVSVEKLISTGPMYDGVTGLWTMKFHREDAFHSFLVLSFVEETRVLSVGLSFNDITDDVGFNSCSSTLACGWIEDGWVAQICKDEVRVCAPTMGAHEKGMAALSPFCTSWTPPGHMSISLGTVSHCRVILGTSRPGILIMLGLKVNDAGFREFVTLGELTLEAELSCISVPQEEEPFPMPLPPAVVGLVENNLGSFLPSGVEVGKVCIIGTHKPSVEVLSIVPEDNFSVLAVGHISLINTMGTGLCGCVPEDARLVLFDRPYILVGLRNGMLLRFDWPTSVNAPCSHSPLTLERASSGVSHVGSSFSAVENMTWNAPVLMHPQAVGDNEEAAVSYPVQLHLIAVRRMGVSPVSLVPLQASLRADVVALGDRPWLLQTAWHSERIACTSISFLPSTHATAVKSRECMQGILFVADKSLHLVEMEHSKRLNVQRHSLRSTPRKIAYHAESKTLLVLRSEWCDHVNGYVSDICCVDPVTGASTFSYKFDHAELPKCMELCRVANEHLLLVGTGLSTGKAMMANGEPIGAKGRLIIFQLSPKNGRGRLDSIDDSERSASLTFKEGEGLKITYKNHLQLSGVVLAVAFYLDQYILACAGNKLSCISISSDGLYRFHRHDSIKTRFVITCISVNLDRIVVGDCRDGILFYTYQEYESKLEQLYCDPAQRLVADCVLVDPFTAVVTDRHGNFSVLRCPKRSEDCSNPERNLIPGCWYHMGEVIMSIRKGSLAYKVLSNDISKTCSKINKREHQFSDNSVVASTLLGSIVIFLQLTREEYELLDAVQSRLAVYPLTTPVLGNNHAQFRGKGWSKQST